MLNSSFVVVERDGGVEVCGRLRRRDVVSCDIVTYSIAFMSINIFYRVFDF